jgi:hypothetical protein
MTRQKNRAFRKARTTGKPSDKKRYQKLKSTCQKNIRAAHDNYMRHHQPGRSKKPKEVLVIY